MDKENASYMHKKHKMMSSAGKWIELEIIMLSDSWSQQGKCHNFSICRINLSLFLPLPAPMYTCESRRETIWGKKGEQGRVMGNKYE